MNKIKNKQNETNLKGRITRIYLVWNIDNKPWRVYIGKTKGTRKSNHKLKFGRQIEYDYIDEVISLNIKDWKPLETYWIQWFINQGYEVVNKNKNGGSGPSFHKEETKQKISKLLKGKPKPKNFGKIVSKYMKGNQFALGRKDSKEVIERRIKSNLGISRNKAIPRSKNIRKNIGKGNKGKKFNNKIKKHLSKIRIGKKNITVKKPVIQYDLNMNFIKEYISLSEAARSLGVVTNNISACCLGNQKTCCGFIFKLK